MIHYHGGPVTPRAELLRLAGRSFCVSYASPSGVDVCHEIGQSVMLDNGAFSFWRSGKATNWPGYYEWCERWLEYWTTWAVIPDVIDGTAEDNDALIAEWPFGRRGAPVWHLHEPIERLLRLAGEWPLVCLGSSGEYGAIRSPAWWPRMHEAMDALCGNGPPPCALHMLRGLALAGGPFPLASADSTAIARNHAGGHQGFWDPRPRPKRDVVKMADALDALQCPARWSVRHEQLDLGLHTAASE